MENRRAITYEQWKRLAPVVSRLRRRGPRGTRDRLFVAAVVWVLRNGAPWRDRPRSLGMWSTVYQRFRRWTLAGRGEALRRALAESGAAVPGELLLINSTIVKAHPHAAGARKRGERDSGEGARSIAGRVHDQGPRALVSGGAGLVRYRLTGGHVNDVTQANSLVRGLRGRAVVGDRAYDADEFLATIAGQGMTAVIPSRASRKVSRRLEAVAYAQGNVIECFFGRLKGFRRIATRYDKTAVSYAASWALAASVVVLSGWAP